MGTRTVVLKGTIWNRLRVLGSTCANVALYEKYQEEQLELYFFVCDARGYVEVVKKVLLKKTHFLFGGRQWDWMSNKHKKNWGRKYFFWNRANIMLHFVTRTLILWIHKSLDKFVVHFFLGSQRCTMIKHIST